jgi:hypothetical protein
VKAPPASRAALGLFRALLQRADDGCQHRILLSQCRSIEWQSLTFAGERHILVIRLIGPDADALARQLTDGLTDAEFNIAGHLVADINASRITTEEDKSVLVTIEALTIGE